MHMNERNPRIEFLAPGRCRRPRRRYTIRDDIEKYDEDHERYEDLFKRKFAKVEKKKHEAVGKAIRRVFWFLTWGHIIVILEVIAIKYYFGF